VSELDLLRAHEPIVRYTKGEMFFPCSVEGFVQSASLWVGRADEEPRQLVPSGELNLDKLAAYDGTPTNNRLYLRFASEPLSPLEYQRWLLRPERIPFRAAGRLARVPLLARIADSLFDLSLLVRGRVPGGTAAASEVLYRELCCRDQRRVYYGRVVRSGGWTVLHYLFFYTMNDWRSSFYGANEHESDWEQVFVYVYTNRSGERQPRWVACASHDFKGDDLRRRWDDPLLHKEGGHPVVYAGAGSHASYFQPGEYTMGFEPRFLKPAKNAALELRRLWVERLGQGAQEKVDRSIEALISIPFVDYARGDGLSIGPGQEQEWAPILISEDEPWVDGYRGLWGLDTHDPFSGERAPAGPKYNRDGSVRQSWYDPLGWGGLDKIMPPADIPPALQARLAELDAELAELDRHIEEQRKGLRRLALDVEALRATDPENVVHKDEASQLAAAESELQALQARRVKTLETRRAIQAYQARVARDDWGHPPAHIRRAHQPQPPVAEGHRIIELWAAVSGALALLALVLAVVFAPDYWWVWLIAIGVGFGAVEAATHGRIAGFLLNAVIVLAMIASAILVWEFWRVLAIGALAGVVIFMIRDNLRELTKP
jgi:hypothetical protein